jgi:molybdopterin-guanine dinucleotide biosynthesis protein A
MNFSAVILAGGKSSRMGRDKAWIKRDGRPLVAVAAEKIRRLGVEEVFISGRADADYSALNFPVLRDERPELGPLSGMERGLAACRSPLLLVLAVDLARMTPEFLQRLMAQCDPLTGVVPELATGLEPLAAIYPKRSCELARTALRHSRLSARGFAETCQREQAVRFWPVPASETDNFFNWNCPDDLPPE